MKGSVLVVGCGYLGQHIAAQLHAEGGLVYAMTRSEKHTELFQQAGWHPVVGDVCERGTLGKLPRVDTVFHAVGFDRHSGRSRQEVSVEGLRNLLQALPAGVTRVVHASSTSVYGEDGGEWVDEETEPRPKSEGGRVCLAAEKLLLEWAEAMRVESVVIRYSGLYGPNRIIRKEAVARGEPIPAQPDTFLNLIQIDDAAHVAVAALVAESPPALVVATDNRPIPRREYYETLARLMGVRPPRFEPSQSEGDSNKRLRNAPLKESLPIALRFPTIDQGLPWSLAAELNPGGESSGV